MGTVEVAVNKLSGYEHGGYGLVFCYQDNDNYYKLLITTQKRFMVYEVEAGFSTAIIPWSDSNQLDLGYDTVNTIRIVRTGSGDFEIFFNENSEDTFTDDTFTGGQAGYYVSVQSEANEFFPITPVDVRFKLLQPTTDP